MVIITFCQSTAHHSSGFRVLLLEFGVPEFALADQYIFSYVKSVQGLPPMRHEETGGFRLHKSSLYYE